MTQEELQELLLLYPLGLLSVAETQDMEAYLAQHPELDAEADRWWELVAELAYAAPPKTPSDALRVRLLKCLREPAPKIVPASATNKAPLSSNVVLMPSRAAPIALEASAPRPAKSNWWMTIAAAVALVSVLAALFIVWRKNQLLQAENRALAQQLNLSDQALREEHTLHTALLGPDGRGVFLQGTKIAPKANANFSYNIRHGKALLWVNELPPAPAGKSYQIWFFTEGQPIPGKTFNTGEQGSAEVRLEVPSNGLKATSFAVTLEPHYGANAPTGEKYLAAGWESKL